MTSASTRYYVHDPVLATTHGPLSAIQFRALVDAGAVRREDPACRVGDVAWATAEAFTGEAFLPWPARPATTFAPRREAATTRDDAALPPVDVKALLADTAGQRPPPPPPTERALAAAGQRRTRLGEWVRAQVWFMAFLGLVGLALASIGLLNSFVLWGLVILAVMFALGTAWIIGTLMS